MALVKYVPPYPGVPVQPAPILGAGYTPLLADALVLLDVLYGVGLIYDYQTDVSFWDVDHQYYPALF